VLSFILDMNSPEIPPGSVAGLISIVLGFLALFLGKNDRTTRLLAVIVLLPWFALFIVILVMFLGGPISIRTC
jgi:hypothetical protein